MKQSRDHKYVSGRNEILGEIPSGAWKYKFVEEWRRPN